MSPRQTSLILGLILAALPAAGCFNSETDYERLVEEKEGLMAELTRANQEKEILNRALENIKREQERLQILLNTSRSSLAAAGGTGTGLPPLPPLTGDAPAIAWDGEYWGQAPAPAVTPPASVPRSAATAPASSTSSSATGRRTYKPKDGDVLSSIAQRHNTTVDRLLELNPRIAQRRNYMIWTTDEIVLP